MYDFKFPSTIDNIVPEKETSNNQKDNSLKKLKNA